MLGLAAVLVLLAVPCWHQAVAHRVLSRHHAPTEHEQAHARRPMWLRVAANAAWLAYLAGTVALGLALR